MSHSENVPNEHGEYKHVVFDLPPIQKEPRFRVRVLENVITHNCAILVLDRPEGFRFVAGQYVWLVLPERTLQKGIVDRSAFSIASGVTDKKIELFIRLRNDSEYLSAVSNLAKGDLVEIIGPMGSEFTVRTEGVVMISGGTGIAPFMSLVRSKSCKRCDLYAYYDAERPLPYLKELKVHRLHKNTSIHVFGEQPTDKILPTTNDVGKRQVLISGPQLFVDTVTKHLLDMGVEREQLHYEACYPSNTVHHSTTTVFEHLTDVGEIESRLSNVANLEVEYKKNVSNLSRTEKIDNTISDIFLFVIACIFGIITWQVYREVGTIYLYQFGAIAVLLSAVLLWRVFGGRAQWVHTSIVAICFFSIILSRASLVLASLLEPWILVFPIITRKLVVFRRALVWDIAFIICILTIFISTSYTVGTFFVSENSIQMLFVLLFLSVATSLYAYREDRHRAIFSQSIVGQSKMLNDLQKVARLSELFIKILNESSNHIIITDANGRILYANKGAERLTGYSFAEMRGQTPRLWGGLMSSVEYQNLWKKNSQGNVVATQILNRRRNGELYVAIGRITPIIDKDKKVVAYVATEEDVTELARIDKTKSEFVSLASHQLRTPLSSINWYSEMLLAGDVGKLHSEQKKYVTEVYDASQRMVALVNALLNVSRIDLGSFVIEPEPTNLKKLLHNVFDEQKQAIEEKNLHVKIKVSNIFKVKMVNVDPKLMRIVYQNLLSNSVKYTPVNGTIELALDMRNHGQNFGNKELTEDVICFTIRDTGYGIPKAQQNNIFSKLFRADNAKERDTAGTGLGLYIVKSILEHSGGSVWFESEEHAGTTFFVILPARGMIKKEGVRELG